jgi:uncharacterized protein YcgI (DUF1989 family)
MEVPGRVQANRLRYHLEPQTGIGLRVSAGQAIRVIDPQGEQVSDITAFAAADKSERLSPGRTMDHEGSIHLVTGGVLYSNRSRPMLTIVSDTVGKHDLLLAPCSEEMFRLDYGQEGHPSCLSNLASGLAGFGIEEDDILGTFNIFMNVDVLPTGELRIDPPLSRPGDSVEFRAEMDLFVGITACSAEKTNNGTLKPIDVEVLRDD